MSDAYDNSEEYTEDQGGSEAPLSKAGEGREETVPASGKNGGGEKAPAAGDHEAGEGQGAWAEDWRERIAEHASAGDRKAYERELKRLQRFDSPPAIYGMARSLENAMNAGNVLKLPGEDATDEEYGHFLSALGVPEEPVGYLDNLQLANGAQIGDEDIPMLEAFAEAYHQAGGLPTGFHAIVNQYYAMQEEMMTQQIAADEAHQREGIEALREEYGPNYQRTLGLLPRAFEDAAGGMDLDNPSSVISKVLSARPNGGHPLGNDPDVIKWLASVAMARGVDPTEVDGEIGPGRSVEDRISEIEDFRRQSKRAYFADEALQAEYRRLVDVRERRAQQGNARNTRPGSARA